MPWGSTQTAAFVEVILALTSHLVLTLPDWQLPFTLHTDASTLAARSVLTQRVWKGHSDRIRQQEVFQDGRENLTQRQGGLGSVAHE